MNARPSLLTKDPVDLIASYANELMSLSNKEQVVWHLAHNVVAKLGFVDVVVYLFEDNLLVQKAAFGNKNPSDYKLVQPLKLKLGQGVVGTAAQTQQLVNIGNTQDIDNYIVDDEERLSELAVPMVVNGKLIGVIDSEHPQANFYTKVHERLLTIIASLTANKLQNTDFVNLQRTVSELKYSSKIQDVLFDIAELIFTTSSLKGFFNKLHVLLGKLTYTKNFIVALQYKQASEFVVPFAIDQNDHIPENTAVAFTNSNPSPLEFVLRSGQTYLLDKNSIKSFINDNNLRARGSLPNSWLGVPFGTEELKGIVVLQCYDDSYTFNNNDSALLNFVAKHIFNAVERLEAKSQLEHMALHDSLTGLSNRTLFLNRLSHAISSSSRSSKLFAVLFIDVDGFKDVNDNFGHHAGDKLLKHIAQVLENSVRKSDLVCRLGGDEFAILIESANTFEDVRFVAERILKDIQQDIAIDGQVMNTSFSIGVCYSNSDVTNASDMLNQADEAMYIAKAQGKNQIFYHNEKSSAHLNQPLIIEREFSQAIADEQLKLVFQPIVAVADMQLLKAEALIRWHHPEYGLIPPDQFIPALEKAKLTEQLDLYVLKQIIKIIKLHRKQLPEHFKFNINISTAGFGSGKIKDVLNELKQNAAYVLPKLCFEITEQSIVENVDQARRAMKFYRALGITIALDDFGTGYSSLSYLHNFRFDTLKLDRSFINAYIKGRQSAVVLEAIIKLANTLKIKVTAEGIETKKQMELLKKLNCDKAQGYYIAQPDSLEKIFPELGI